jgi:zinc protease
MKKTAIAIAFSLVCWSQAFAATTEFKLPKPDVETLSNGLRIVWFTSDKLPIVDLAMTVKAGARDDLPGKSGTAELVAATLDRGAGGLTARQIAAKVEALGAFRGASVDDDFFQIHMHGLAVDADTLVDLMAKVALQPEFPADEVKRERSRMLDSWNRLVDYGDSLVDLAYRRMLSQGTEYARGSIVSSRELAKINREDVVRWWKTNFTPGNTTILVVGRVDRNEFRNRLQSLFGNWKGQTPKTNHKRKYRSLSFSPHPGEVVLINRPDNNQAQVRMGFRAPLVQDPRHYPLTVANALLGEYFHSRLNTLIRDKLGLTYGISSSLSYNKDLAMFTISAATRNEASAQLIKKSLEVVQGLRSGPIPGGEVSMAKDYLIGGFPLSTSTLESVAGRWLLQDLFGLGPDRLNQFVPKISAVSASDVSSAVHSAFRPGSMMIAVSGDAKAIEPVLTKAGFKVRRVSRKDLMDGRY